MLPRFEILPNSLKVVLVPCEAESVAVGFFIAVGSRFEKKKLTGISHFVEHMLFKGTPSRKSLDITRAIEGRGGNFNAFTSEESTCYYIHLPSDYASDAIEILSDMYLNASVDGEEFEREKQVIIEEIKMYADEPSSVAAEKLQRNIFPCSQLGESVSGTEETLCPMTRTDLLKHIDDNYVSEKTVVAIAGNFDEKAVLRQLSSLPVRKAKARRAVKSAKRLLLRDVESFSIVKKDICQAQLAVGYRAFGHDDDRRFALLLLDALLGRGMSSRLFQQVREKHALSYDISSGTQLFSDTGFFTISAGLHPDNSFKAISIIDREIEKICERRVSSNELKRTKEFVIGNSRLSNERVTSKLFYHGSTMLRHGKLIPLSENIARIRAVTTEDIYSLANEIFNPKNRSVSWVVPNSADEKKFSKFGR